MDLLEPRTDFELQTFAPLFATHGSSQYFFSLGCGRMTCTSWCRAWLSWLLLSMIFFLFAMHIDLEVDDFTLELRFLIVGGGGGGHNGGGGGGGVLQGRIRMHKGWGQEGYASWPVKVGAGGKSHHQGESSLLGGLEATGGGHGGARGEHGANGADSRKNWLEAKIEEAPHHGGGGGGGGDSGGNAGYGEACTITGTQRWYGGGGGGAPGGGGGGGGGPSGGGGGGGGAGKTSSWLPGTGGKGGGGDGSDRVQGCDGEPNTGGGGGGSDRGGGHGGSGIVIVSYKSNAPVLKGGDVSVVNGHQIHSFTTPGVSKLEWQRCSEGTKASRSA
ncbi:unnamed protein product [Durusdinium trenchii]|uniref:Uncharacterized protein n=1 Tax=Durusdinium trenchii TaxID=1381693 RepID=A0ABP0I301_9DINO